METKFNLYDVFGYFIPGSVMVIVLYLFLLGMGVTIAQDHSLDWSSALILIPVAYVIGNLIHQFMRPIIHVRNFAVKLASDNDNSLPDQFKVYWREEVQRLFGIDVPSFKMGEKDKEELTQKAFNLCYDYVIQSGKGVYTENFNAVYGMFRSMIFVVVLSAVLALVYVLARPPSVCTGATLVKIAAVAVGMLASQLLYSRAKCVPRWPWLLIVWAIVAIAIFCSTLPELLVNCSKSVSVTLIAALAILAADISHIGMRANAERFVRSVYRSFYVARKSGATMLTVVP
jgi:hypothetical protein